ncbi:Oxygen-dependent coproporphyrinogen-III oxidase, mitochondrial [Smittium culicis]|uniref:coproporphyrinogen oxidase n=1 Tax=Smittium culicis TaxID=133412 RepID=A0A1R1Y1S3_9FUNG|nr:Oxygen-dependent coproporphyrinogen-III oxidase, mitochondrial [Smittium culicis]
MSLLSRSFAPVLRRSNLQLRQNIFKSKYSTKRSNFSLFGLSPGASLTASFVSASLVAYGSYQLFMDKPDKELVESNKRIIRNQSGNTPKIELDYNFPTFDTESKEPVKARMEKFVLALQKSLVGNLERLDNNPDNRFLWDRWTRDDGNGYGISCVLQDSKVFEKAGVNVSIISGPLSQYQINSMRDRNNSSEIKDGELYDFWVAGISTVIHPTNPMAPTTHFNYRYFEIVKRGDPEQKVITSWFGGGADLTPSYVIDEDCRHFHSVLKEASDKHDPSLYPKFKKNCDEYFYIPHRKETRGVGGIFFDDLKDRDLTKLFHFVFDMGFAFQTAYLPLVQKNMNAPFTTENKIWQSIRRGRYVEFNLINDRGTKFGLFTPGARIESILMSLPLSSRWEYMQKPKPNSEEERTLNILKNPVDWPVRLRPALVPVESKSAARGHILPFQPTSAPALIIPLVALLLYRAPALHHERRDQRENLFAAPIASACAAKIPRNLHIGRQQRADPRNVRATVKLGGRIGIAREKTRQFGKRICRQNPQIERNPPVNLRELDAVALRPRVEDQPADPPALEIARSVRELRRIAAPPLPTATATAAAHSAELRIDLLDHGVADELQPARRPVREPIYELAIGRFARNRAPQRHERHARKIHAVLHDRTAVRARTAPERVAHVGGHEFPRHVVAQLVGALKQMPVLHQNTARVAAEILKL